MSYSIRNRAWDNMLRSKAKDTAREETEVAQAIMRDQPGFTWGEAMRRATIIVAQRGN